MKELIEDLRVNADAHPLDVRLSVMIDAADALESQAREIERLTSTIDKAWNRSHALESGAYIPGALDAWKRPVLQNLPYDFSGNPGASATQYCNGWNDAGGYWKAYADDLSAELSALKAKPSGVVLPPSPYMPGVEPSQLSDYERGEAQGRCDMWAEVARLNQPASAGDERETIRAVFLRNGFTIKEGQTDLKPYVYAAAAELMSIARTALSANHSEQARDATQKQARKTWRAGNPSYLCHHCNTPLMTHEKQVYCPEGPAFASNSTAAPSAGLPCAIKCCGAGLPSECIYGNCAAQQQER